jgi:hypothetical protein
MCYFIGIRSNFLLENHRFIEDSLVLVTNAIHQHQKENNKSYYLLTLGGCSCKMVNSNDNALNQKVRSFLSKFPGNQESEVMLHWEGEDIYEIGNNYEKLRPLMKQHIISKEDFLDLYPSLERDSLYILT